MFVWASVIRQFFQTSSLKPSDQCEPNLAFLEVFTHTCSRYISYINIHLEKTCWFKKWILRIFVLKIYRSQTDCISANQKSAFISSRRVIRQFFQTSSLKPSDQCEPNLAFLEVFTHTCSRWLSQPINQHGHNIQ
jgi:hypothetical protein